MPLQPVSQNFSAQPIPVTSTGRFTARPGDTLSQVGRSDTGGCSLLSALVGAVTGFFRWLFCCSDRLPEWSKEDLLAQLNPKVVERSQMTFEVVKLSRDAFVITVHHMGGFTEYACIRELYEGAPALRLAGKWDDQSFYFFHAFPKSTTLLLERLPECLFGYAKEFCGCKQDGALFIREGSAELAGPAELGAEG